MKILQLVTKRQYRGAEVFAANLSTELITQGHQIIFAGLYISQNESLSVEHGVNIDLGTRKTKFSFFRILLRLVILINKEKPHIIQANGSDTLKFAVASRLGTARIPIVYRNISMISSWMGTSKIKKRFYGFLFKKVDHITSVGESARRDLINFFNFPEHKVSVIRRGIPINAEDKPRSRAMLISEFQLKPSDKIVIHIGNFSKEKNQLFLIEVFKHIHKSCPDVKLIMVGKGEEYNNIQKQVERLQLQREIFFAGFRPKPETFLAGADLAVLCSLVEGVPGVVLEAGAQRVPVLAVNVGGIPEVVRPGETGVLIPNHDVSLFAESMVKILYDALTLKKYGDLAYNLVCNEFDPRQNALLFIRLYADLAHEFGKD